MSSKGVLEAPLLAGIWHHVHAADFIVGSKGSMDKSKGNSGSLRCQASYVVNNLSAFSKFNSVTQEALEM